MSAIDTIKEVIARLKFAKGKLKTWLTNAGITVPDGTKLSGMVDMLDGVDVSWSINDASHLFYKGARVNAYKGIISKCNDTISAREMFYICEAVESLDLKNFDTSKVTDMYGMFYRCESLKHLDISGFDTSNVKDMSYLFFDCKNLDYIDVHNFNTSKVTSMMNMFSACSSLKSLDVSNFDTSHVQKMTEMFGGCSSLESIDVSGFDTSNVISMDEMFMNCSLAKNIDVSGFNTRKLYTCAKMFSGCSSLESVDVSGFDTSNVTSMAEMFKDCARIKNVDISGFHTGRVTTFYNMFCGCSELENIDFSNIDTSQVGVFTGIFDGCYKIKSIIGFSATKKYGLTIGFPKGTSSNVAALKRLTFRTSFPDAAKKAIRSAIDISYCSMERSGFVEMANTLTNVSKLGISANYKKITIKGNPCVTGKLPDGAACDTLTAADRAIATSKGWTIVT